MEPLLERPVWLASRRRGKLWRRNAPKSGQMARSNGRRLLTGLLSNEAEVRGRFIAGVVSLRLVIACFLMTMSRNDDIETNAVCRAAESVGNAANRVGDAVTPADKTR